MAPPGPSPVEIRRVRDRLDKLQVRANTVHDSLNSLLSSMQAQGLGLSSKFTQPAGLMDTYLRSAGEAFNQADLPATRSYAEKAEHQIEILEKLLNL